MIVIGLAGQPLSGKDTVADYLLTRGFVHISTSDMLRQEMAKRGIATDRESMRNFAAVMRKQRGDGYLAEEGAKHITENTVVSGLRNTSEVKALKNRFGDRFVLVAVTAPIETRFERARTRGRIGDDISFEIFKQQENAERKSIDTSFEVDAVIGMADTVIENSGTKQDFTKKIEEWLAKIKM